MVVDFLFLSTSVAFVFSTIKESIKAKGKTGYKNFFNINFFYILFNPIHFYIIYICGLWK